MEPGFKKWAEETAVDYRQKLSLKYHEHLCGFVLAEHLQIPVLFPSDFPDLSGQFSFISSTDWSAVTFLHPIDGNVIILNNTHSNKRQQSDMMHEISHIICNHSADAFEIVEGLPILRKFNREQEKEAGWLGGCLQLPRRALIWALNKGMDESQISEYHIASLQMVNFRLRLTGAKRQFDLFKKKKNQ